MTPLRPQACRASARGIFLRLASAALLALAVAGCRSFPLSLWVDEPIIEALERTEFRTGVPDEEIAAAMAERLGFEGERTPLLSREYHRVDLAPIAPFPSREANDAASPWLAGLESGDVLLAKNYKAQSLAATLALRVSTYYDHMGLLVLDGDEAWVYECWPRVSLLCVTKDFASRYHGKVDRVPLGDFLARYETVAFARFPDPERNRRAVEAARDSLHRGIVYDPYHDPDGPELSCSEYLEMLLVEGAGYEHAFPRYEVGKNAEIDRTARALGFHTTSYIVPDVFLSYPGARIVGTISVHESPAEVLAMREAYRLLHERDRPDAPAGNYITTHPWDFLVYREETLAFLEWSKAWSRAHPTTDAATVREVLGVIYEICFQPADA